MTLDEFDDIYGVLTPVPISNDKIHINGCITLKPPILFGWIIKDNENHRNDHFYYLNMYEPKIEVFVTRDRYGDTYYPTKEDVQELMNYLNNGGWENIKKSMTDEVFVIDKEWWEGTEFPKELFEVPDTPPNYMEILNNQ